ncbi:unnamed protein product [Miscanthus lutarioriparius]|uniref:Uncharacterized protein n=1 Tax=Miscanthus lutarioriparius TaxID=422564 RepID=A0A811Q9X5_9POAL|nr:unnamed protein product [Miscanthus lutarioriparius]
MGDSVPGEYFIGRPASKVDDQPQAAAAEPKLANTQIPGDYFVGTPENLRPQGATAATEPAQPAGSLVSAADKLQTRRSIGKPGGGVIARKIQHSNLDSGGRQTSNLPELQVLLIGTNELDEPQADSRLEGPAYHSGHS